jgi:hypothetical protein
METNICGIVFCIIMALCAICCIPPFLQAKEYNNKLSMFFSVFSFLLMVGLIVLMICKMYGVA